MNILCRVCRSWILQRRIEALVPRLEGVVFVWSHDGVLARTLVTQASRATAKRLDLFRRPDELRIVLCQTLLQYYRQYQTDHSEVLHFAPDEQMAAAREPIVRRVRQVMQQLEEPQRLLIGLIDLGGCSYTEAARALNISHAELLNVLCNTRAQLKSQLLNHAVSSSISTRAVHRDAR